jgi:hypothetical protein
VFTPVFVQADDLAKSMIELEKCMQQSLEKLKACTKDQVYEKQGLEEQLRQDGKRGRQRGRERGRESPHGE